MTTKRPHHSPQYIPAIIPESIKNVSYYGARWYLVTECQMTMISAIGNHRGRVKEEAALLCLVGQSRV